jgi:hypothetical protein
VPAIVVIVLLPETPDAVVAITARPTTTDTSTTTAEAGPRRLAARREIKARPDGR